MHYWKCVSRISLMEVISQAMAALEISSIRHKHPRAPVMRAIAMNGAWLDPPGPATTKAAVQLSTEAPELVESDRTTEECVLGRALSLGSAGDIALQRFDIFHLLPVTINPDELGRSEIRPYGGNRAWFLCRINLGGKKTSCHGLPVGWQPFEGKPLQWLPSVEMYAKAKRP